MSAPRASRHPLCCALLVAAVALLSACGGSDGDSATGSGAAPPTSSIASNPTLKLSGTPATSVAAGTAYAFQPTVTASGGTVTFSVTGLPGWAQFDPSTGAISGTPTSADVGMSGSITLSASDDGVTASLASFTIDVTAAPAAGTGSATLSWTAPTVNTNGTPITDLAGYYIHYGTVSGSLTSVITVPGASTTEYEISNLPSGTYYFTVSAYNSLGVESAPSNEASKTI